LQWFQY